MLRKSRSDKRFHAAEAVWNRLSEKYLEILSDDATPDLSAAVSRISQLPFDERKRSAKDLGETMVVAHAAVKAEAGQSVIVIIDDGQGALLAQAEKNRLNRLRVRGQTVGTITITNTVSILGRAAGTSHVPDRAAMRAVYKRLRECDDGLLPIDQTNLLSQALWTGT